LRNLGSFFTVTSALLQMFREKFLYPFPCIFRRLGFVDRWIAVAEKSEPGLGIYAHFLLHANFIEKFFELLNGPGRDGLICITEETQHRRLEMGAQLIEDGLHPASIERANGLERAADSQRERHPSAETESHASDLAGALVIRFQPIINFLQIIWRSWTVLLHQQHGFFAIAECGQFTVIQVR